MNVPQSFSFKDTIFLQCITKYFAASIPFYAHSSDAGVIFCHCNNLVDVMAGVYTEETLRALNKNQTIDLFLKT